MCDSDSGCNKSSKFEYECGKQVITGIFCEECSEETKNKLTPCFAKVSVLFVLHTNDEETFYVLTSVNKQSLKMLIESLQTADAAFCVGTFNPEQSITDVWSAFKEKTHTMVFEVPKAIYLYFLNNYLPEQDKYNCAEVWFKAPKWPNANKKKQKLEKKIATLQKTVTTIQNEIQVKQLKLEHLLN